MFSFQLLKRNPTSSETGEKSKHKRFGRNCLGSHKEKWPSSLIDEMEGAEYLEEKGDR